MPDTENTQAPSTPECCCGPKNHEITDFRRVETAGKITTNAGEIDIVTNEWSLKDYLGAAMVRLGFLRMNYAVRPGIYAVGKPGAGSPVFISANYKLSFDMLRRDLAGIDGWIMVLDTKGVNVWCAAGKGTFGTKEVVSRIIATKLGEIVFHQDLIVPQLGAPGVSAFKVMLFSGFKIIFGPVRSKDIKKFMSNGMKADGEMRKVKFGLRDRLVVSALELAMTLEKILPVAAGLLIIYSIKAGGFSLKSGFERSFLPVTALLTAVISGTVLTAGLLPYLPGKAFSIKGGILGLITAVIALIFLNGPVILSFRGLSFIFFVSAAAAYLALNFTGSSTFTSLSGTKKEVKFSVPVIAGILLVSIVTFIVKGN